MEAPSISKIVARKRDQKKTENDNSTVFLKPRYPTRHRVPSYKVVENSQVHYEGRNNSKADESSRQSTTFSSQSQERNRNYVTRVSEALKTVLSKFEKLKLKQKRPPKQVAPVRFSPYQVPKPLDSTTAVAPIYDPETDTDRVISEYWDHPILRYGRAPPLLPLPNYNEIDAGYWSTRDTALTDEVPVVSSLIFEPIELDDTIFVKFLKSWEALLEKSDTSVCSCQMKRPTSSNLIHLMSEQMHEPIDPLPKLYPEHPFADMF